MEEPRICGCGFCCLRAWLFGRGKEPTIKLLCRTGAHRWRRWQFARGGGESQSGNAVAKQYRYCADCNLCQERRLGFEQGAI